MRSIRVTAESRSAGEVRLRHPVKDHAGAGIEGSSSTATVLKTELESAKKEISELTERCANLRQMNEELLGMLERMYAEQEKK